MDKIHIFFKGAATKYSLLAASKKWKSEFRNDPGEHEIAGNFLTITVKKGFLKEYGDWRVVSFWQNINFTRTYSEEPDGNTFWHSINEQSNLRVLVKEE